MTDKTYRAVIAVGNSLEERVPDRRGIGQRDYLVRNFGLPIDSLTISKLWIIEFELAKEQEKFNKDGSRSAEFLWKLAEGMLMHSVVHACSIYAGFDPFGNREFDRNYSGDWVLRYGFKTAPFVSDVEGDFVKQTINEVMGKIMGTEIKSLRSASQYTMRGKLSANDLELIANQSPIDSKCHRVAYFPKHIDDMEAMQSPIEKQHSGIVYLK